MNPKNYTFDFTIPQGPTGPAGPSNIRSAYLTTFNNGTISSGITIPSGERLPIDRKDIDESGLITLDPSNETIQFNVVGYYKISFTVSAYTLHNNATFDPKTDIVSIGFKKEGTDEIYVGASRWATDEVAIQLVGQGILSVTNIADSYVLENVGKNNIYLHAPDIQDLITTSYFSNCLVTIVIEYLGE